MRLSLFVLFVFLATSLFAAPFRVAVSLPPGGGDWRTLGEVPGRPLFLAVADGLLGFDPVTGFVKPGLAQSWTSEDGGTTWTFTLKAARWSDGSALTADDFVQAWTRSGARVSRLEAPDPRHLKAVFPEPLADVSVLTSPGFLLFPDASSPRKGCGPFVVESQEPGHPLVLVKNPLFREASTIRLERLEFRFVSTLDEAQALYRDGLLDWVPRGGGPGTVAVSGLKNAVVSPGWGAVFLRLNLRTPRLGDAAYRASLNEALDRVDLAQGLRGPVFVPSVALVPSVAPGTKTKKATRKMGPVPEPALTILYPVGETYRSIALGVADQWNQKLGIAVETKAVSFAQAQHDRALGAFEVALGGWWGDFPDPTAFLSLFRSGGSANDMGYSNPTFDGLLDQLVLLPPGKARVSALTQAQAWLATDWPVIPLLGYGMVNQIDLRRWAGWSANPTDIHPWQGIGLKK